MKARMKKLLWCTLLLLLFTCGSVSAVSFQEIVNEKIQAQDMGSLDSLAQDENGYVLPEFQFSDAAQMFAVGGTPFEAKNLFTGILQAFFGEVYTNLALLLKVIVVAILFSFLNNLKGSFDHKGVSDAAYLVCYTMLAGILFQAFLQAANLTQEVVSGTTTFVSGIVPMLITLMMSSGAISTAAAFQPVMLVCIQIVSNLLEYFFLPLFYIIAALSLVDNLNDKFPVTRLTELLKKAIKWALGFILTLFVGIMGIQGFATSVLDGATGKAAKYVVGNFVPVVGSILSETVDTVAGCSLVVKNAVGAAGLVAILVICITPILKLAAMSAMFYITAAVIEPVGDKRIVKAVGNVGSTVGMMVAVVSAVALMFILCISMMIAMGSNAAMMR